MTEHRLKEVEIGTPDDRRVYAWRRYGAVFNLETGEIEMIDELVQPRPRTPDEQAAYDAWCKSTSLWGDAEV